MKEELSGAICRGDRALALALLEQGASAAGGEGDRQPPLILALKHDFDPSFCEALLARGASLERPQACSALFAAAQGASERPLAWLARQGVRMDAKDDRGRGLFHCLAARVPIPGDQRIGLAMAEEALRLEAPLDEMDALGWSPLGLATVIGNAGLALWLLDHGARADRLCGRPTADLKMYEKRSGLSLARAARERSCKSGLRVEERELAKALASRLESLEQARALSDAAEQALGGRGSKKGRAWI